jgi:hypothetical protein
MTAAIPAIAVMRNTTAGERGREIGVQCGMDSFF